MQQAPTCHLFIDADNQPPALATGLAALTGILQQSHILAAVVGNSAGRHVVEWEGKLREAIPGIGVNSKITRLRRQSADAQLMFELAALYHATPTPLDLVIVVSRDEHLIAAAEILAAKGHHVLLAVAAIPNATLITSTVPVVLMAAGVQEGIAASESADTSTRPSSTKAMSDEHARVIDLIRHHGRRGAGGGYAKTEVGAVLAKQGYGKLERKRLLQQIPARRSGSSGKEILYFE